MGGSSSGILSLPGQGPRTPMSAMLGLNIPSFTPATPMAGPQTATQVSPAATSAEPAVTSPQPSVQLPSMPTPQDFVQPQPQALTAPFPQSLVPPPVATSLTSPFQTPAQHWPMAQALASNLTAMPNQMANWQTAAPLSVQRLMSSQQTWPVLPAQYLGNSGSSIFSNPLGNPFSPFNPFFKR
jgi:hypothetical protein